MSELSDRLIILLFAATLLLGVVVGWVGGFVETASVPLSEPVLFGLIGLAIVLVLFVVWWGFDVVD